MVPYGALCANCDQIQTSKATPCTTAWPTANPLGTWEGIQYPEEELLQSLDVQPFEHVNVPHEHDEWGRCVYNVFGNRLPYYQGEYGNTVIGNEAWYPCSVIGDYEEPSDWRPNNQFDYASAEHRNSYAPQNVCARPVITDIDDDVTVVSGYEEWYSCFETHEHEREEPLPTQTQTQTQTHFTIEHHDRVSALGFEQRRFAEFLAAQNDALPRFASDGERIAAWIAAAYVAAGGDDEEEDEGGEFVSFPDLECSDVVSLWSERY